MLKSRSILSAFMVFLPMTIVLFEIGGLIITPYYLLAPIVALCFLFGRARMSANEKWICFAGFFVIFLSLISTFKATSIAHFSLYLFTSVMAISMITNISDRIVRINKIILYILSIDVLLSVVFYTLHIDNVFTKYLFPFQEDGSGVRFPGLTSEPSYFAFIVSVCMMIIIHYKDRIKRNECLSCFIIYAIALVASRTTFGFLLFLVVLVYAYQKGLLLKKKVGKSTLLTTAIIVILLAAIIVPLAFKDNPFFLRLTSAFRIMFGSGSMENFVMDLNDSDGSAAFRILPSFLFFNNISLTDIYTWVGHGFGTDSDYFTILVFGNNTEIESIQLGFIPAAIYSLGLFGAGFLLYTIVRGLKSMPAVFYVLFVLALVNCNISTQLFWFIIIEFYWIVKTDKLIEQNRNI